MNNFISIDPSGMGKNGLFYFLKKVNYWPLEENKISIETYNNDNWVETSNTFENIFNISNVKKVYIEDIKYTFDKVGLETITTIKLIAVIEKYCLTNDIKLIKVTSDRVKSRAKWFKDINLIKPNKKGLISKRDQIKLDFCKKTEITWEKNKYFYKWKKINAHERDAILIYYIGEEIKND